MSKSEHFDAIGFDADDTLWFSEDTFRNNENRFVDLVSPYAPSGIDIKSALVATERVNIGTYGYGVKSFGLSAVEAAITITMALCPLKFYKRFCAVYASISPSQSGCLRVWPMC